MPFNINKRTTVETLIKNLIAQDPGLANYRNFMAEALSNMKKNIVSLETQLKLEHNPKYQHLRTNYKSEIWEPLETALDCLIISRDWPAEDRAIIESEASEIIKNIFSKLTDAGLPFLKSRTPVFWSSQLGKQAAFTYANGPRVNGSTDEMALEHHRLILIGSPSGTSNVLYPIIKQFPSIAKVWGMALSEEFAAGLNPGDTAHVFFQDSMMVGNFFWDVELPIIREKASKVILHIYDVNKKAWPAVGIDLDSGQAESIILRRMFLSDDEKASVGTAKNGLQKTDVIETDGNVIFKEKYDDTSKVLQSTKSPRVITIHKIRSHIIKWKYETKRSMRLKEASKSARAIGLFAHKDTSLMGAPSTTAKASTAIPTATLAAASIVKNS